MPFKTPFNVSPYYDTFTDDSTYGAVMFKPSVPLQARELNELQSILRKQIERFGHWAFKNGDIVYGCSVTDVPMVPYVRLADFQNNGASYDIISLANTQVVSTTSNLTATILYSNTGASVNYPNTNVIYVKYRNTGTGGETTFSPNEQLTFYVIPRTGNNTADTRAVVNTYNNTTSNTFTTGNAHGISVSEGVVFINGSFVKVQNSTFGIVNNFGTYAGNNVVGFVLNESIVTDSEDSSLLDNALGYSNENAPGADRLSVVPALISLSSNVAANTDGFNPIATYNFGGLVSVSNSGSNLYSIVGDAIAQRIYEEAGNYVVNPFVVDSITNVQSNTVGSNNAFVLTTNTVFARINPGVGYAQGYRVEVNKTAYVTMRRGVDTQVNKAQQISFGYGGYFLCEEFAGGFDFDNANTITLYDAYQNTVTNRTLTSVTPNGNNIGNAQVRCVTLLSGVPGQNVARYAVHVFNIKVANGYNVANVKSIYSGSGIKGCADLVQSGQIGTNINDPIFSFGVTGLKALRDGSNNNNSQYVYRTRANTTMASNGFVSYTLTSSAPGGVDILPYGNGMLADVDATSFKLTALANAQSLALSGTVQVYSTNNYVAGTSSTFTLNFNIGSHIKVNNDIRTVNSIINSTAMTVDSAFSFAASGQSYYRAYLAGEVLPISSSITGLVSNVNITNSTSFNIKYPSTAAPNTAMNVDVCFDVLRTSVLPAQKEIRRDRFVKIDTTKNPYGPWCLGFSDVHRIRAVYANSSSSYTTSGVNVTNNYVFDSGQKDTHYDLGYLYPKAGYDTTTYPYLLVQLDYFNTNTATGLGFYTVESYPVNDGLPGTIQVYSTNGAIVGTNTTFTSNFVTGDLLEAGGAVKQVSTVTNATFMTVSTAFASNTTGLTYTKYNTIKTSGIPLYIDGAGNKRPLRDHVDFRPMAIPTANDTGYVDPSNSSQITTAIGYATTVNASTNATVTALTLSVPATGLHVPSYGRNFQADYTFYLPRKDLVYITPDNKIKVKEGLSSLAPQTPLYPENAMALAIINVPPYPTLSTDQVDSLLPINQSSRNLVRDTSLYLTSSLVTNRRYSMRDIGKLDKRITNLEYYQALTLLEKKATDLTVTDADGLDRFKNGIFVDPFNDFTLSDVSNPEYSIAIDSTKSVARPHIIREVINIDFANSLSTNVKLTGRLVTIDYTSVPFIVQPYATKYRSSAHVSMAWNGTVLLIPPYDNHNDLSNTGSVNVTVDLASPWQTFAQSPFGMTWGDWRTTTNTQVSSVVNQQTYNVDLGYMGGGTTQAVATQRAIDAIHQQYGQNVIIGNLSVNWSDVRLKRNLRFLYRLANGIGVYLYRYLWSDQYYVGVLAQEVAKIIPAAVITHSSGYMMVDYSKLGEASGK